MMKKKGKIEEIVSYKERNKETHRSNIKSRPGDLRRSLDKLSEGIDDEFLKYFPVALVNAMEVYFKRAIEELINHDIEFSERAEPLAKNVKIDFEMIHALQGKSVTLGEIIAHSVPIGNYSSIANAMTHILGFDFSKKISIVHDRWAVEVLGQPLKPILPDPNNTLQVVQDVFTTRHIIAHEMPYEFRLDRDTVRNYIYHTELFLYASDEIVSETLHPGSPLTQHEMNMSEFSSLQKEQVELERAIDEANSILSSNGRDEYLEKFQREYLVKLQKAQSVWEDLRQLDAELEADEYLGGSIWPMIYNGSMAKITKDRAQFIKSLFIFGEMFSND